tara:strand:- start:60 stop:365 length:306 start_codon:yes stop_codon:yes gene_type:complete
MVDMTSSIPQQINSGNTTRMESQVEADERATLFTAELENKVPRAWAAIRTKRDKLLAESDWMANSDVTMSDPWTAYRKALRDLPASKSDPDDIVFPDAPES